MGRTRYAGPVYGAKETLLSLTADVSGSSGSFARFTVPAGEDWYATEMSIGRESTGVSGHAIVLLDDSSVVSSLAYADVNAGSTVTTLAADAGEDEGTRIAAGSVLSLRTTSTATGRVSVLVRGFTRFLNA